MEQLEKSTRIHDKLVAEESNPYIKLLDPCLEEMTDIIKICLEYAPIHYCIKCKDLRTIDIPCLSAGCRGTYKVTYKIQGPFRLASVRNDYKSIHPYDDDFMEYFSRNVRVCRYGWFDLFSIDKSIEESISNQFKSKCWSHLVKNEDLDYVLVMHFNPSCSLASNVFIGAQLKRISTSTK